jgi:hypothetical protein
MYHTDYYLGEVVRADAGIFPKDTGVDGRSEDMPKDLVE